MLVPNWVWLGYYRVGLVCLYTQEYDTQVEAKKLALNSFGFGDQQEYTLSYPGGMPDPIGDTPKYITNGIRTRRTTNYPHLGYVSVICFGENGNKHMLDERKELFNVYRNEFEDSENNNLFIFPPSVNDLKKAFNYKKAPSKTAFWFCLDWKW